MSWWKNDTTSAPVNVISATTDTTIAPHVRTIFVPMVILPILPSLTSRVSRCEKYASKYDNCQISAASVEVASLALPTQKNFLMNGSDYSNKVNLSELQQQHADRVTSVYFVLEAGRHSNHEIVTERVTLSSYT